MVGWLLNAGYWTLPWYERCLETAIGSVLCLPPLRWDQFSLPSMTIFSHSALACACWRHYTNQSCGSFISALVPSMVGEIGDLVVGGGALKHGSA